MSKLKYSAIAISTLSIVLSLFAYGQSKFPTSAKVTAKSGETTLSLKPEEEVALLFIEAMQSLEDTCDRHCTHQPSLDELVKGPATKGDWNLGKLKYDPRTDPNYTYAVKLNGDKWEISATPKKPELGGFLLANTGMTDTYYNPKGAANSKSQKIDDLEIIGDTFVQP